MRSHCTGTSDLQDISRFTKSRLSRSALSRASSRRESLVQSTQVAQFVHEQQLLTINEFDGLGGGGGGKPSARGSGVKDGTSTALSLFKTMNIPRSFSMSEVKSKLLTSEHVSCCTCACTYMYVR